MIKTNYTVKGKNINTNRTRQLFIKAFSLEECMQMAYADGMIEPIEILSAQIEPATDKQIEFATKHDVHFPAGVSKIAMSDIISFAFEKDRKPSAALIHFAESLRIEFSDYIGEKKLLTQILNGLSGEDQVAFYAFTIHKLVLQLHVGSLAEDQSKELFVTFGKSSQTDIKFVESFKNYLSRAYNGDQYTILFGAEIIEHFFSSQAYAIEKIRRFLQEAFDLEKPARRDATPSSCQTSQATPHNKIAFDIKPKPKAGCMPLVLGLLIYILVSLFI